MERDAITIKLGAPGEKTAASNRLLVCRSGTRAVRDANRAELLVDIREFA